MKKQKPLTSSDGEVRELTVDDFRRMRPLKDDMPELIEAVERARLKAGRPPSEAPKTQITFRFDADLVEKVKGTGRGYGSRVEKVIREAYEQGKLRA